MSASVLAAYYIPGVNVAFLASTALTLVMVGVIILYGKRRPVGKPLDWGEAMVAAVFVFAAMFLAYGIVPHQFLTHADNELAWRKDKYFLGFQVGDRNVMDWVPFDVTYVVIRDLIVVGIYAVFLGLNIWLAVWWQQRGKKQQAKAALPESSSAYGRPLVRKA